MNAVNAAERSNGGAVRQNEVTREQGDEAKRVAERAIGEAASVAGHEREGAFGSNNITSSIIFPVPFVPAESD